MNGNVTRKGYRSKRHRWPFHAYKYSWAGTSVELRSILQNNPRLHSKTSKPSHLHRWYLVSLATNPALPARND